MNLLDADPQETWHEQEQRIAKTWWGQQRNAAWDKFHAELDEISSRYNHYPYGKMPLKALKQMNKEKDAAGKRLWKELAAIFWKRAELSAPGAR